MLFLGIGGGVLATIVLVALLSGGGDGESPPRPPDPAGETPSPPKESSKKSTPDKPIPKKVPEKSARDIEKKMAEDARKAKASRLDNFILEIQKTIDKDRRLQRTAEIERMITSALTDAGSRQSEIEAIRTRYHERMKIARETLGHWTFDDLAGTPAVKDSSASGRDGSLTKGSSPTPGKFGGAVRFDGVAGAAVIEKIDGLSPHAGPDGELTVSLWVKLDREKDGEETVSAPVVAKGSPGAWEYAIYIWSSGSAGMTIWQLGGSNYTAVSGATLTEAIWHHVVGVLHKGKYLRLYIDGTLKVETKEFKGKTNAGTSPLYFGRRGDGKYFKGALDDVRIYGRALIESEIKKLSESPR